MPEFHLDTDGAVEAAPGSNLVGAIHFHDDLDAFTQGYIEALFFTSGDPCGSFNEGEAGENDDLTAVYGFSDLAPETLAAIIEDCRTFQMIAEADLTEANDIDHQCGEAEAGRDFWYTRNGHGCGFWDGDWPEPYATALTDACKAFRSLDAYPGDDGKVYLS